MRQHNDFTFDKVLFSQGGQPAFDHLVSCINTAVSNEHSGWYSLEEIFVVKTKKIIDPKDRQKELNNNVFDAQVLYLYENRTRKVTTPEEIHAYYAKFIWFPGEASVIYRFYEGGSVAQEDEFWLYSGTTLNFEEPEKVEEELKRIFRFHQQMRDLR